MAVKTMTFKQMTRQERKVAIAKDVIANLDVMDFRKGNGYVVSDDDIDFERIMRFGVTNQQIANEAKKQCQVCARGAMMLCKIGKFNEFDFSELEGFSDIDDETTTDALEEAFDQDELEMIESCFEGSSYYNGDLDLYFKDDEGYQYTWGGIDLNGRKSGIRRFTDARNNWSEIEDDKDRLRAIMQNIIDHKGDFKPTVMYEVVWA